jgi:hypothetical protein
MVDLKRGLQPLIDQPPAEPEPIGQLEVRARQRRRRRRMSFALAVASLTAILVSVSTMWSGRDDRNGLATTGPAPLGPTQPVVVASGEIDGQPWRLQAYLNDSRQCLDLLEGGRACFDAFTQHAVDVAVDYTVIEDANGTARTSVAAVYGPVRRDVARVAIRLGSGVVVEAPPLGQDAGFGVNFYVAQAPTDIPAASELSEVIAYDATDNELDRLEPDCAPRLREGPAPLAPDLGEGQTPLAVQIRADGPCRPAIRGRGPLLEPDG